MKLQLLLSLGGQLKKERSPHEGNALIHSYYFKPNTSKS